MASYVIFEPPGAPEPERAIFVRDGFHWLAFLLPVFWFLWHGLWIAAVLAVAALAAFAVAGEYFGLGYLGTALSLLLSVYAGLEGPALRLARLRRRGWREWGVVEADNAADAETRYLAEMLETPAGLPTVPVAAGPAMQPAAPALGLFAYPGGR